VKQPGSGRERLVDDTVHDGTPQVTAPADAAAKDNHKLGRALRIETVINSPTDLRIGRRLHNLDELQDTARAINDRLLHTERAGQGCVLANPVFERIAHPTVDAAGRRATAMRFGDSRVQALAGALCVTVGAVTGITNRSLRALMTGLLGTPYTMTQASYDLARLCRNQLITRRPHANTYDLTPDGLAFAIFYTKVHDRILAPGFPSNRGDFLIADSCNFASSSYYRTPVHFVSPAFAGARAR
jgi:hypothetical protein